MKWTDTDIVRAVMLALLLTPLLTWAVLWVAEQMHGEQVLEEPAFDEYQQREMRRAQEQRP